MNLKVIPFLYKKLILIKNNQFLRQGLFISILLVIGKLLSFGKDFFVAQYIGISKYQDAYVVSFTVIGAFINFLFSVLNLALITYFAKVKMTDTIYMNRITNSLLILGTMVSIVIWIIFINSPFLNLFFTKSLDITIQKLIRTIIIDLTPYFLFNFITAILGAYLVAQNKNFLYSFQAAVPSIITIFFFLYRRTIYQFITKSMG